MVEAGQAGSLPRHVASPVGHHPQVGRGVYGISKAGMMSRVLALELAPHRVRSNTVSPGSREGRPPKWPMSTRTAAARDAMVSVERIAEPVGMANVIAFLASERSGYVNLQDILVDGGMAATVMNTLPRSRGQGGR